MSIFRNKTLTVLRKEIIAEGVHTELFTNIDKKERYIPPDRNQHDVGMIVLEVDSQHDGCVP